jgi:putative oxidoreductase
LQATLNTAPATRRAGANIWQKVIATENDYAALVTRVTLGLVMLPHGLQKTFGLFGGYGFSNTMGFFTTQRGVPAPLAVLVIMAEFLGALGLIFGVLGRVGALGIIAVMAGAVMMVHLPVGFFMDWNGTMKGEVFEYHLLAMGLAAAVLIKGSGALSFDRWLTKK